VKRFLLLIIFISIGISLTLISCCKQEKNVKLPANTQVSSLTMGVFHGQTVYTSWR